MKENLAEIDTDQDGAVSKAEFDAMVARRSQSAGGGPDAGRGDAGRPQRPAADDPSAADEPAQGGADNVDAAPAASDPAPADSDSEPADPAGATP
jgi:hypothetical protein